MNASNRAFIDELVVEIRSRRSFGGHPLWHAIAAGKVSRAGLGIFARQFYLQVNEFPRAVSALHASCPYTELRHELAESLYEEETGRISGCNLPHPRLFGLFANAVGVPWEELVASWRVDLASIAASFSCGHAKVDPKKFPYTCRNCDLQSFCRIDERIACAPTEWEDDD